MIEADPPQPDFEVRDLKPVDGIDARRQDRRRKLTNDPGAAAVISPVSGSGQSAITGTDFADPLVVLVADQYGNPVPGVVVTFTGPVSGTGATFPTGSTAATGADGTASATVAAGATAGE